MLYETLHISLTKDEQTIEQTIIKINLANHNTLIIGSIYAASKNERTEKFTKELSKLCDELDLDKIHTFYLLAGDLNARHKNYGDVRNNSRGYALKNWEAVNTAKYKLNIISTQEPSFPSSNAFIDLCLIDTRINVLNLNHKKIQTLAYDSDHRALLIQIETPGNTKPPLKSPKPDAFIFKKTKWKKFTRRLQKHNQITIPDDINLETTQIDNYIKQINKQLVEEMNKTIPKSGEHTNKNPYTSKKIKKMTKYKSHLLTKLHLVQKHNQNNRFKNLILKIKSLIKFTRNKINYLINDRIENHWEKNTRQNRPQTTGKILSNYQ